jgi:hypothetical protein
MLRQQALISFLFAIGSIVLLTSCDEENPNAPGRMRIHEIKVTKFPEFDGSSSWDDPLFGATTMPDPYLMVHTGDTTITEYFHNVANETLQFFFSSPIIVWNTEDQHYVQMWDRDDLDWSDSNSPDDFMGGLTFIPWQVEGDEDRTEILLENSKLKMILYVDYK